MADHKRSTNYRDDEDTPRIPYTTQQLIDAISLEYETGHEGNGDLTINYDDAKLQEPSNLPPPGQGDLPLPGVEPLKPHEQLTQEMRDELDEAINKAFDKEADGKAGNMDPPEYLQDSAKEFAQEDWSGNLTDEQKFEWTKNNTSIIADETTEGTEPESQTFTVDKLPEHFDPLNETSGEDYKRTQAVARVLSVNRAEQVLKARGLPVPSKTGLQKLDARLWQGWKQSSTNQSGRLLQVATADELGGRLNAKTATDIDAQGVRNAADEDYKNIGGYAGVKAYVRAKWETTQYLLDKAGMHDLTLYRGIRLERDVVQKLFELLRALGKRQGRRGPQIPAGVASRAQRCGLDHRVAEDRQRLGRR